MLLLTVVVVVVQLDPLLIVGHVDHQSKHHPHRRKFEHEHAHYDILAVRLRHRNVISVRSSPTPPQPDARSYRSPFSALIIMEPTSFTFLATILILVLLSASLVLRSYILRRRYRQRFQQALADGLFVDLDHSAFNGTGQFDTFGGFRRSARRLGPKPVLWDTWIHPADKDHSWSSITVGCSPFTPFVSQ